MDSSNVEYYYSNAGETQTVAPGVVKCRWFFDAPERLYQKVGLDTIYYPRAPGRPSRNALMKFDRSLGRLMTLIFLLPPKGLRSKVRTISCGLRDTVQVAQQPSGNRTDSSGPPLSLGSGYQLGSYTSLSRMTDPRLQLLFAKGDAF
jgi:hypothetical protein